MYNMPVRTPMQDDGAGQESARGDQASGSADAVPDTEELHVRYFTMIWSAWHLVVCRKLHATRSSHISGHTSVSLHGSKNLQAAQAQQAAQRMHCNKSGTQKWLAGERVVSFACRRTSRTMCRPKAPAILARWVPNRLQRKSHAQACMLLVGSRELMTLFQSGLTPSPCAGPTAVPLSGFRTEPAGAPADRSRAGR